MQSKTPTIILASASPRRQQFLRDLKLPFNVIIADIDETPQADEAPIDLVYRLAELKAQAVAARLQADTNSEATPRLIIAADTIVALGDQVLGKPASDADAKLMLTALRNQPHHVHSAVSALHMNEQQVMVRQQTMINSTAVFMRTYTDAEIDDYIASGDPHDKAGAYAIQNRKFNPVTQINGCLSGVMGLSLIDLRRLLADFGVPLTSPIETLCESHSVFLCCQRKT